MNLALWLRQKKAVVKFLFVVVGTDEGGIIVGFGLGGWLVLKVALDV